MYAITGATGNVGRVVANELLANRKSVVTIGRNADKLDSLVVKGAVPFVGDLHDAKFVNKAFEGTSAVFCIIPPDPRSDDPRGDMRLMASNYINAVKTHGIKYVVLISSVGAHLRNGAGIIDGLADMEVYFSELKDVNILVLRPTFFMESILSQIEIIKHMNVMGSHLNGDLKFPMVAAKDVGTVAAKRLLDLKFKGHTVEYILGPRDISYNEITKTIGKAIGKHDLKYIQFSQDDMKNILLQSGAFSESVANLFIMMEEGINNGKILTDVRRTPENTTPTELEEFTKVFAKAFDSSVPV